MRRPPRLASDAELVALAHGGCDDAFGEIARRHRGALVRACSRIVGPDLAEDAAQQALLKALLTLRGDGAPPAQIRPWLLRVAHNASIDIVRRQALESGGDPGDAAELEGPSRSPIDVLEGRRELRTVVREIGRLPERQRQALLMRAIEGHGYEQIASALDASEGMVRQLIYRARERVRAAAAAVFAPLWLVHLARRSAPAAHGGATAAGGSVAGGTALKVGAVVAAAGIAAVGGVTVTVAHHPHGGGPEEAHAAAPAPKPRHRATDVRVTLGGRPPARRHHPVRPHVRPAKRVAAKRRTVAVAPAAPLAPPAPPRAPAHHQSPHAAPAPAPHHTQSPPSAPATTPTPPPTEPPPPTTEQPPPPAGPPAPPTGGHVASYQQSPGFGGPLTIERANGESVTAYFGELVALSCYFVRDGHVVSHETCTKERLHAGTAVALAEHGVNSSGHDVWTRVDLLVPAP